MKRINLWTFLAGVSVVLAIGAVSTTSVGINALGQIKQALNMYPASADTEHVVSIRNLANAEVMYATAEGNLNVKNALTVNGSPVTGGGLGGTTGTTDTAILRASGTGGATVQSSLATIDSSGSINIPTGQSYKINGTALATGVSSVQGKTGAVSLTGVDINHTALYSFIRKAKGSFSPAVVSAQDAYLVAAYKMESGALTTDSKGSNTLSNVNGVTSGTGKAGQCGSFASASTQKLTIGSQTDGSVFLPSSASGAKYLVSFWMKQDNDANAAITPISCGRHAFGKWMVYAGNTYVASSWMKYDGNTISAVIESLSLNHKWTHVAFGVDGSNIVLWVDGVKATGGTYTTLSVEGTNRFDIGIYDWDNSIPMPFNGLIDEVYLWKSPTIGNFDEFVSALYASGAGVFFEENVREEICSDFALTLLDDTDAATARATLGATSVADLTGTAEAVGGTAVVGVATTAARSDHKHAVTLATTLSAVFDGGGSALSAGSKCYIRIPYACSISKATLIADQTGTLVIDVWKDTYANYPPTVADTITASAKPTLSAAAKYEDSTLTGWTKTIAAGDVLAFVVDSCTTCTWAQITLEVTR